MAIDLSTSKLINMIRKQIKKEKDNKQIKKLNKSLKNAIKLQKQSLKKIKSNSKKYKITRKDKIVQNQWQNLLNNNHNC